MLTSGRMWVLRMTACSWPNPLISSRTSVIWRGSRPTVGSSRISTSGVAEQRLRQPHALAVPLRELPDQLAGAVLNVGRVHDELDLVACAARAGYP